MIFVFVAYTLAIFMYGYYVVTEIRSNTPVIFEDRIIPTQEGPELRRITKEALKIK